MLQGLPFWSAGRGNQALSVTNLVLAAAQPIAAYAPRLAGRGVSEAERASKVDGPVSPAPGAFVIWLPLFATSLAHGARIARGQLRGPALRRATWLMSAAYSCNAAWSIQAQLRGLGWPSVAIISTGAASASAALIESERVAHRSHDARMTARAVAPLAGWLTLATFANLEATLNETGGRPDERRETQRSLALLSAACVSAGAIALASRGNPLYTAAVAWGLAGVTVRNARSRNWAVTAAAGLGLAAAVGATLFGRRWARSAR
jgi:hypothetical protein